MKDTYAQYCTKYDDVSTLLEQVIQCRPDIRSYFNQGLDEIAKHRPEKPFTVDAFLKPLFRDHQIQLLLLDIIASTEKLHPDIQPLKEAQCSR
ncbi:hypothetical protein EB796_023855 [Bugula neritina]|uniref:DH domain-containing protein n=1 Tax=Bugula neritina TaxID=10212 RepID=A0A7J7IW96_BUGNE|nr:hypothetical protein EB796_023855 [Bugula neritina]